MESVFILLGILFVDCVAANRVLRARSETIGYAVHLAASVAGMMEYWNAGMMGLADWDLIL